ncbi:TIGR00341 family protein [Saprospiraceae bacterium]|nr:TIGR00341 family protein [Saprospiraceae bacterium]
MKTAEDKATEMPKANSKALKQYFSDLLKDIIHLERGVDKKATILEIKSKQSMSGANAWMLMCSIMIASIGLNLNSQAVIIGAMLISPLMSPILGIGLGVAINDKNALSHALMHFSAAIIIALVTSTLYFMITPLDELTPEIEARTTPTFLDILIAVFGGIAGILSIARKDIATTLPGVAIATALMPPLCVAGFGIANGEWGIASKAFYLFFLNTFFVAFATYVILRRMRFPNKVYTTPKERRKNIIMIALFSIMMIIPSLLIFKTVFIKFQREKKLKTFIEKEFSGNDINYIDGYKLFPAENPNKLILKVYGTRINQSRIPGMLAQLNSCELKEIKDVEIISTSEIDLSKVNQVRAELSGLEEKLSTKINLLTKQSEERSTEEKENILKEDFYTLDSTKFSKISSDLKLFYPDLEELSIAVSDYTDYKSVKTKVPVVIVKYDKITDEQENAIRSYVAKAYELDSVLVIKGR